MDYFTPGLSDPMAALGLPLDATDSQIRERYLKLVRRFPPEKSPERFRAIRAAYDALQDPIDTATKLLNPPESDSFPSWTSVLDEQKNVPPILPASLLMSLGNRD